MIVIAALSIAILLRAAAGREFEGLGRVHLKGEVVLLWTLAVQVAVPALPLHGASARVVFYVWFCTLPLMATVAWVNRQRPGMVVLALGLVMNGMVIAANGGMPVSLDSVSAISSIPLARGLPAGDFVHVALGPGSPLAVLADVIPLPGPPGFASIVSPGDVLLYVGLVAAISSLRAERPTLA